MVKYKYVSISARLTVQSPLLSSCLNAQLLNAHNSCFQGSGSDFLSIATRPEIREILVQSNQKANRGGCSHKIYQLRHSHIVSKWREGSLSSEHVQRTDLACITISIEFLFWFFPYCNFIFSYWKLQKRQRQNLFCEQKCIEFVKLTCTSDQLTRCQILIMDNFGQTNPDCC